MTREEAIKDIEENILPIVGGKSLRMAIDALRQPERASETTTWLGSYSPYTCEHCEFHVDSKTRYCPDCGRRANNYE